MSSPSRPAPPTSGAVLRSLPASEDFATLRRLQGHVSHPSLLFPYGLFSDSSFPGSQSAPEPPAAASPSALNLIEALTALTRTPEQPPAPPSPALLIELQGDRYVRVNNGIAEDSTDARDPGEVGPARSTSHSRSSAAPRPSTTGELPPALLVFRDGHREEVRDYSIVGGVMYARGDYYTDGYWNKKIDLTALNLPETAKSNAAAGIHFVLPTSPNEVVTRP